MIAFHCLKNLILLLFLSTSSLSFIFYKENTGIIQNKGSIMITSKRQRYILDKNCQNLPLLKVGKKNDLKNIQPYKIILDNHTNVWKIFKNFNRTY